jgi:lipoprotein NlpI
MNENPDSPEPQNLLGIWYEFQGNNDLARRHYRAAYALDPTYKPSSINLERISTFFSAHKIPVDFGEEQRKK